MKTMNFSWSGTLLPVLSTILSIMLLSFLTSCTERETYESKEAYQPKMEEYQEVEQLPVPLNLMDIKREIGYPKAARESGIEGKVIVRIKVEKDGTYAAHEVLFSDHDLLQQAVEDKLESLTFEPAMDKGVAVPFWVNLPFAFKLLD